MSDSSNNQSQSASFNPMQSYEASVKASLSSSAHSVEQSLKAPAMRKSKASIVASLKASATNSLHHTSAYSLAQQRQNSLYRNINISNANTLISNYTDNQYASIEEAIPNPFKPDKLKQIKTKYEKTLRAKERGYFKPWMKKSIRNYHSASNIYDSYGEQAHHNIASYESSVLSAVNKNIDRKADVDTNNLNSSRLFRNGEIRYQKAPISAIRKFHHQQQNFQYHKANNKYVKLNGLATMMHQQGELDTPQYYAVRDTIRTRYIIKHNHPDVRNDKEMKKYANEARPILESNQDIYGGNVNPEMAIDNPVYQKLMRYTKRFQGGIKDDLQRISRTTESIYKRTAKEHSLIQAYSKQVNICSKYSLKEDPVISKAQQVINKANPVHHKFQKETKAQWELNMGEKDVHMSLIAHKLYPHDAEKINRSIYHYQLNRFHNTPDKDTYLTNRPKTLNVINVYNNARTKGMLKEPQINQPATKIMQDGYKKKPIDNQLLKKIGIDFPNAYIDKAKTGIHKATKSIGNKIKNGYSQVHSKVKHKMQHKPSQQDKISKLEKQVKDKGMHFN